MQLIFFFFTETWRQRIFHERQMDKIKFQVNDLKKEGVYNTLVIGFEPGKGF